MSRLYTRNSRGRMPMLGSSAKFSKTKEYPNDTYSPKQKKSKPIRKYAVTKKLASKRKREDSTASEGESSSTYGSETADDASDEDSEDEADDEDDLPAVKAPSRSGKLNGAGRKHIPTDNLSVASSSASMFEVNGKGVDGHIDSDSDDDSDIYRLVDDISDSDEDLPPNHVDHQDFFSMIAPDEDEDFPRDLDQIDGLSYCGFGGEESEDSFYHRPSSQGTSSASEIGTQRHVHFAKLSDLPVSSRLSSSPTMSRSLLPSALAEGFPGFRQSQMRQDSGTMSDDLDDSDLTDDCLPEAAHQSRPAKVEARKEVSPLASSASKKSGKKPVRRRGPPKGVFIDEGDKTSGILDSSGKVMILTNPHLLGEKFSRRYGASQTSSPDLGFAELLDESDIEDRDPDTLLASLNSGFADPMNGNQVIGPFEGFYPSDMTQFSGNLVGPDDMGADLGDLGEDVIKLEDLIKFDDDADASDGGLSPPPSIPSKELCAGRDFAHLNGDNASSFGDPFANVSDPEHMSSPFATPAPPGRKRKSHTSPYTSSHYKGVTPVHRVFDRSNRHTLDMATPAPKRRRVMTS